MTDEQTDEYFMREALKEAKKAFGEGEVPIGCVITAAGKIIARACNYTEKLNDVTAHAEMQAITAAANGIGGKYLMDCTIYITVEPCIMCAGALSWAQAGRVVYGASDNRKGFTNAGNAILHPKTTVKTGVLADECAALMKEFFASRRK
jgi:tRNA(adenine34) deaminase